MSDATRDSSNHSACTTVVSAADVDAHVAKVKAAWRERERAMTWEEKIAAIERMRERNAQLVRAREKLAAQR